MATELPAASSAEGLAGEYQLRLVATSGARKGAATEGKLRLEPQTDARRPLYGSTDVDLAAIDAVLVGNTTSHDPMQPGVLVLERHAAAGQPPLAEITIRLGSDANRRDRQRFDGGYTALRVRQIGPGRLAGSWASGVTAERAGGYFCATKKDGR